MIFFLNPISQVFGIMERYNTPLKFTVRFQLDKQLYRYRIDILGEFLVLLQQYILLFSFNESFENGKVIVFMNDPPLCTDQHVAPDMLIH